MKHSFSFYNFAIIFSILSAVLILQSSIYADDKNSDDEISKLTSRIETLEKIVSDQESKISQLTDELEKMKLVKPFLAIPQLEDSKTLPKGSTPFKFNDKTYYMVPLDNPKQVK